MADQREAVQLLLTKIVERLDESGLSAAITSDPVSAGSIIDALAAIALVENHEIEWTTINGRRVDVAVVAPGREWRAALSIDGDGVHSASVFERPSPFPGVPGGRAVIVNGPSSAGKSTVMEAVVESAPTPWVMFDELSFGRVAWPFLIWRDRAPTLPAGFLAGITALAQAGNQVILAGSGRESSVFDDLRQTVPTVDVGLDCPLDVRIDRQSRREDRWGGLTEGDDDQHRGWTYDLRFDTSRLAASDIATRILRHFD